MSPAAVMDQERDHLQEPNLRLRRQDTSTRVRRAWNKFMELRAILTARGASLKVKAKIYT